MARNTKTTAEKTIAQRIQDVLDEAFGDGILEEQQRAEDLIAQGVTDVRIEERDGERVLVQEVPGPAPAETVLGERDEDWDASGGDGWLRCETHGSFMSDRRSLCDAKASRVLGDG
jgi:hypothetical protein